jgi:hypothetical protein
MQTREAFGLLNTNFVRPWLDHFVLSISYDKLQMWLQVKWIFTLDC